MALNEMDARLISQGAETTAIGSSALVSVAEGAGQPQKNIKLGNFADSMAKAVPQKTKDQVSITGLYAKTTDGNMVELTSDSVVSVVAELLSPKTPSYMRRLENGSISDANNVTESGFVLCSNSTANTPEPYGTLISYYTGGQISQTFVAASNNSPIYSRSYNNGAWTTWQRVDNFGYNSLADLAGGVAEVINSDDMLKNKMLSSFQGDKVSGSFNDLLTGGMYYASDDVTDGPTDVSSSGLVITLGTLSNYRFQIFSPASSQHYYARKYIYRAWTAWAKISV